MRTAVLVLLGAALVAAGCTGPSTPHRAGPPPGCGLVPPARVVGLVGEDVRSTQRGTLAALRARHRTVTCTTADRARPQRYVRITARYHPTPVRLPSTGCGAGQVFAGTPEKFAPACQEEVGSRRATRLTVRWQPYVMEVTVSRTDPNWSGDAELALAMSRVLAQRLDVAEAAGDG